MTEREAQVLVAALNHGLSRLTHALRTPLGTALSVVADLVDGHQLSREELQDGKDALLRIKAELQLAASFVVKPSSPEPTSVSALIRDAVEGFQDEVIVEAEEGPVLCCDRRLTAAAFAGLSRFLAARTGRNDPLRIVLSAREGMRLEFSCSMPERMQGRRISCWSELSEISQNVDGLAPHFAEAVFVLTGGRTFIESSDKGLRLWIEWPPDLVR